uniref:Uncharacterized protein n=1 Tax=Strombidium inclinatum TaxID=197538 RepID=A0A7S3MWJ1_9SPIT|mmetsp:Transcript_22980/g.35478  ORF Transcript_22980/g.35478 Transcript_22980/m.35478 type:complete len:154 (+) Transcript_22980:384-845(+)
MMRAFRTHLKQQFNDLYLHKQYHWVNSTKKKVVREFFLEGYGVPEEIYDENEAFFLKLIYNTLQNDKISAKFTVDTTSTLSQLLDEVMKAKPNNKNLKRFFAHRAVQLLWGGKQGKQTPFREGGLSDLLRKMSVSTRQWFCSKLEKVDWQILG